MFSGEKAELPLLYKQKRGKIHGKFHEKNGRIFMPLSLTCHHAATDGCHISAFLDSLNEDIARAESLLAL